MKTFQIPLQAGQSTAEFIMNLTRDASTFFLFRGLNARREGAQLFGCCPDMLFRTLALGDVLGDGNSRPVRKLNDSTSCINHPPVPYLYFEIGPFTS